MEKKCWEISESQNASWNWKKLLKLRAMAQRFVEIKDGREVWRFPGSKYKATAVWGEIRKKKEKSRMAKACLDLHRSAKACCHILDGNIE